MDFDVIVIGGGLAGLSGAIRLAEHGLRCAVVSAGQGALFSSSGSLDLLSRLPDGTAVTSPPAALPALARMAPRHPYSILGAETVATLAQEAQALLERCGLSLRGSMARNHLRITPLGTRRATWLSPTDVPIVESGQNLPWHAILIAGIEGFLDFQPALVADTLTREQGLDARATLIHLPVLDSLRNNPSEFRAVNIARRLDIPDNAQAMTDELVRLAGDAESIILPACIGLEDGRPLERLRAALGRPVHILPTLPPSLLGVRFFQALRQRFNRLGGIFMPGDTVLKASMAGRRVMGLYTRNHGDIMLKARQFILASGSFFSNGLLAEREGIREPVFNADIHSLPSRGDWCRTGFFEPQPYREFGVNTDDRLRLMAEREPMENVYAAGAVLGGYDPLQQGCGAGVSLISALSAARRILASAKEIA
ncbi:glycerol-3-phosphate dehydrogenase subunit GlpB [Martelella alba]|uniref:Anaerobic glycerol-3-phosphate dehydrogenase subunit B n=1 Tax=Martelella alba TaxID=2590451 RepID=A0ABY2SIB3_9HYPH|nr:glycerol-3-phosphate dehydrogenase subunit GlpB [Martelella alba]TKI04573.1 glycerol-3-phosphate dehydrogenase subunit GlpB [Martelella alba]